MIDLSQNGYTHEEVLRMLETNRTVDFKYDVLDKNNIMLGELHSAEASISFDSEAEIMGTIEVSFIAEDFLENLIDWRLRPAMKILSPNGWLTYYLGTYIVSTPSNSGDGDTTHCSATGYDYALILKEDKVTSRYVVPSGSVYTQYIMSIMTGAGIKKTNVIASSLTTPTDLEWEAGTPKLTIVNDLLTAINYEPIHFDLNGVATSKEYVEPPNRVAEYRYQTNEFSLIKEGTEVVRDTFSKANVFVRYTENPDGTELRATYTNDNPSNILSTVSRGRSIVDVATVDDVADQATLNALTKRIAYENSQVFESVNLKTALMPNHSYRDCIFVGNDRLGLGNRYIEYSWSMDLSVGGDMEHVLKRVVNI